MPHALVRRTHPRQIGLQICIGLAEHFQPRIGAAPARKRAQQHFQLVVQFQNAIMRAKRSLAVRIRRQREKYERVQAARLIRDAINLIQHCLQGRSIAGFRGQRRKRSACLPNLSLQAIHIGHEGLVVKTLIEFIQIPVHIYCPPAYSMPLPIIHFCSFGCKSAHLF